LGSDPGGRREQAHGSNKSLLLVGGKPMLTRVIDLFHDHALAIDPSSSSPGTTPMRSDRSSRPARPSSFTTRIISPGDALIRKSAGKR